MLKFLIARVIHYGLLLLGTSLAAVGIFTSTIEGGFYCFDAKVVAEWAASGIGLVLGGSITAFGGVFAKKALGGWFGKGK